MELTGVIGLHKYPP